MSDPAPVRQTDEDFLEHVRQMKCLVPRCYNQPDAAHLDHRGGGGSDYTSIPLCRKHHSELHTMTDRDFGDKYNLNLWKESHRIFRRYIADQPIAK